MHAEPDQPVKQIDDVVVVEQSVGQRHEPDSTTAPDLRSATAAAMERFLERLLVEVARDVVARRLLTEDGTATDGVG